MKALQAIHKGHLSIEKCKQRLCLLANNERVHRNTLAKQLINVRPVTNLLHLIARNQ